MDLFEPKIAKNQGITVERYGAERGNALIIILVAIALFAALSYALSKGQRAGVGQVNKEQQALTVSEILDYGQTMRRVIQELRISGCDDTEISFENTTVSGYANTNAPADESCHVFRPNGGGLRYTGLDIDHVLSVSFHGQSDLLGIGNNCANSGCTDLYLVFNLENEAGRRICEQINDKLGHDDIVPPPSTTHLLADSFFDGNFTYHNASNANFDGKFAACFNYSPTPSRNIFYYTLAAR